MINVVKATGEIHSAVKTNSVAIVGGGLAGLSCAVNLLHVFEKLTIFDSAEPGSGGASAVSAGLVDTIMYIIYIIL